jgi:cell division protein FtsB
MMLMTKLMIGGLVIFLIYMPGYSRCKELKARKSIMMREVLSVRQENKKLEAEISRLRSDPVYIEGAAREGLGVAAEDEIIYKVVPAVKE